MKQELLKYLKLYTEAELFSYALSKELLENTVNNNGQKLARLTNQKLQQISSINNQKPKVFIVEADPLEFLAAFIAVVIAEVDLFLCDRAWQQQEWQQVMSLAQPDLIFGDRSIADSVTITTPEICFQPALPEYPLIMIPTGGTSGNIRFAMHTWETLSASVMGFQKYFDCQEINSFCTLPLYHVSGLMQFMRSFLTGGNLVICSYKAIQTAPIKLNTEDYFISLVPTQLQQLIKTVPDWLSGFKTVLLGGAPARRSLLDTAREYKIRVAPTYGMTETASGIVALKPEDFLAGNNSSGGVLPHAKIAIEPVDNKPIGNKAGLLEISCASLCLGYYPQLFVLDRLATDDLGYFDKEGYLHLVGRNSQKIITGGENVFPAEVEAVIYATKLVKDVCVVGIPDSKWGQAVTAVYVPLTSGNLNLIKQKLQSQLAKYKQPKNWIQVDTIPRNNRGKINYRQIKAIALQVVSNK